MRFIQTVLILLLACSINSCGFVKTAYNNAPKALSWWLDDYFDFTTAQKAVLNPALHRVHDWHRQNQLPNYIKTLQALQIIVAKEQFSPNEACEKIDQFKDNFNQLQSEFIPTIIEIAPLLTDKQLQYFHAKLEKRALKWKSEWWQETPEEQLSMRLEKIEDLAEKIYGDLNDAQHTLLKQNLAITPVNPALSYAEILRRNEDVEQIVTALHNQSLSPENKTQLVKDGFERLQNSPNPTYQTYANQMKKRTCEIIADLHASTDSKQKQHANDWLESYIVQLSSLSVSKKQ
ncbi:MULTISPECIES: DUF6279 family lipoprotein [Methylotenera]|uniref:DUF6279 family lipoprotein n=1 Tax=Methylotenera TaxID=359407 RepID=UPI00037C58D0|nr:MULTISPECIES: DUF6279 family lipoprotein [Methylotenera]